MTHVRSHKGEPWDEMADSLAEATMNGFCVPDSRTELERWVMSFRGVPVGAAGTCAEMPPRSGPVENIFEKHEDSSLMDEEQKEMGSLRIATLNVLTISAAEEREANGLRIPTRQARLASTFEEAGIEVIGLQECRLPSQLVVTEGFVMVTSEAEDGRDGCGFVAVHPKCAARAPHRCSQLFLSARDPVYRDSQLKMAGRVKSASRWINWHRKTTPTAYPLRSI